MFFIPCHHYPLFYVESILEVFKTRLDNRSIDIPVELQNSQLLYVGTAVYFVQNVLITVQLLLQIILTLEPQILLGASGLFLHITSTHMLSFCLLLFILVTSHFVRLM